ncbi:hypothetical protein DMP16_06590 [Sulfolobus sp. B1]|uniref:hypothetical protein n=1 Tax=Sulfolobaceae TaxID=118883 RepID=UPI000845CD78|nr:MULTISPECIES: hypothetical protein [unclassified Sulfolobus]TRM75854.1 hypothetical protein DJ528_08965 [Sulfolobus sp. B5]TRM78098.1 hypothetical protein DJ532_02490 [Sulfolobus sp. A20-N-F8]TRM82486.1 hypothetical protein DJ524_00350 [Sulfolobus sp. D5]TRM85547.1 hypothetical protein DJ522_00200 [Sulfolobus sp. F3]TRM86510.1 hypothetical protein DJ529_11140 [Sulfolobus sp. C3]TRM88547.1 hypothetical protein DJ521_01660 [Sulfolobus sp. E3]TRM91809.1 hypothetical protein DJ526_06540 [Sulf
MAKWIVPRDRFSKLFSFSLEAKQVFLNYIVDDKFSVCYITGRLKQIADHLTYSFEGEIGHMYWSVRYKGVNTSVINKYVQVYFNSEGDINDNILISLVFAKELGLLSFGVITDVELDALRKYVYTDETTGFYPLRIGIKVFWLHNSVINSWKDYTKWVKEKSNPPLVPLPAGVVCIERFKGKPIRPFVKDFILGMERGIEETLSFYNGLKEGT